jgi:CRISPR-associated protein Cmr4
MKGAFRANFDRYKESKIEPGELQKFKNLTDNIFGYIKPKNDTETENYDYSGAISVSDAKILAFPMRSNAAPFVWITCPAVLKRLNKDLALAKKSVDSAAFEKIKGALKDDAAFCLKGGLKGKILLEDCEVAVLSDGSGAPAALEPLFEYLSAAERLLLVSDNVFDYGVSDCTQVTAQISIDQEKGTTTPSSLRYQEELPADTLMYAVIHWGDSRKEEKLKAETIRSFIKGQVIATHIQVGGDETLGRGIFELTWK